MFRSSTDEVCIHKTSSVCVRRGFTLVELLVVISIIALLMAIMMPALRKARQQARMIVCKSNQKQIAMAAITYGSSHDDMFPPCISLLENQSGYGFPGYLAYHPGDTWSGHPLSDPRQRMLSTYLGETLGDGSVFNCPLAPHRDIESIRKVYSDPSDNDGTFVCSYNMFWGGYKVGLSWEGSFKGPILLSASARCPIIMDSVYQDRRYKTNVFSVHRTKSGGSDIGQAGIWNSDGEIEDEIANVHYNVGYSDGHVEMLKGQELAPLSFSNQIKMYIPEDSIKNKR